MFQGNLRNWLLDRSCHDQYSVIFEGGEKTSIFLNTPVEPTVVEDRSVCNILCVCVWNRITLM